jgi:hypothetical protein
MFNCVDYVADCKMAVNNELERMQVRSVLRWYPSICLKMMKEAKENCSKDNLSKDLNLGSYEY